MVQTVDEARRQRELSKEALERNVNRLEAKLRTQLDWKARLRKDGVKIALVAGSALAIGTSLLLWRKSHGDGRQSAAVSVNDLDDVAAQLSEIRAELSQLRKSQGAGAGKLVVKIASAAAAAAGTYAARQVMQREDSDGRFSPTRRAE